MKGGRGEEGEGSGWGERRGRAGDQDMLSLLSPGCSQVWNMAFFPFWSWKQSTCWRPEDMSSPHVSFTPSPKYHWPVPMWIRLLVLSLCEWLYSDNSFFSVTTQKFIFIVISSCLLAGFHCLWVVFPSLASKCSASRICSFGLKTKAPPNLFHSLCLSKLWFSRNGTLDMNFEWKQSAGSSGRAASLTALLN